MVSTALDETTDLEIDCTDAEGVDIAFVQLIASAAMTAGNRAKRLRLANMPAAARVAFARAGLGPPAF